MLIDKISIKSSIQQVFQAVIEFNDHWTQNTILNYKADVSAYESFLISNGILKPALKHLKELNLLVKWVKFQRTHGISASTIMRRRAALSTIAEIFYTRGIINSNPFKSYKIQKNQRINIQEPYRTMN